MTRKSLVLATAFVICLLFGSSLALADHALYRYKWPWQSQTTGIFTTLPFQEEHGCAGIDPPPASGIQECVDAYDVVVANKVILAAVEASVPDSNSVEAGIPSFDTNGNPVCQASQGFGNFVISVDSDDISTTFAHLHSLTIPINTFPLLTYQGDRLGVQGWTGHTITPTGGCGEHLHWQFSPARPAYIDGNSVGSGRNEGTITKNQYYGSTNEVIGDRLIHDTVGLAIQVDYAINGRWGDSQTGITGVGWVHNAGRGLPMHTYGAGWEQTFRRHADAGGNEVSGIYVRDSAPNSAFWVQPDFWAVWQANDGAFGGLGFPVGEKGPCPTGSPQGCVALQQFEGGFIWTDGVSIRTYSADLFLAGYGPSSDYRRLTPGTCGQARDGLTRADR